MQDIEQNVSLDDCEDTSTKASSNKPNKAGMKIVYTEDLDIDLQRNMTNTTKIPRSPERKLSNEQEEKLLPQRAKDFNFLKPELNYKTDNIFNKLDSNMTILGFLQNSIENKLKSNLKVEDSVTNTKGQTIFGFISSIGNANAQKNNTIHT